MYKLCFRSCFIETLQQLACKDYIESRILQYSFVSIYLLNIQLACNKTAYVKQRILLVLQKIPLSTDFVHIQLSIEIPLICFFIALQHGHKIMIL